MADRTRVGTTMRIETRLPSQYQAATWMGRIEATPPPTGQWPKVSDCRTRPTDPYRVATWMQWTADAAPVKQTGAEIACANTTQRHTSGVGGSDPAETEADAETLRILVATEKAWKRMRPILTSWGRVDTAEGAVHDGDPDGDDDKLDGGTVYDDAPDVESEEDAGEAY